MRERVEFMMAEHYKPLTKEVVFCEWKSEGGVTSVECRRDIGGEAKGFPLQSSSIGMNLVGILFVATHSTPTRAHPPRAVYPRMFI